MISLKTSVPKKFGFKSYVQDSLTGKILLSMITGGIGTVFLCAGISYFYQPELAKIVLGTGMSALFLELLLLTHLLRSHITKPLHELLENPEQFNPTCTDEIGRLAIALATSKHRAKKEVLSNLSHGLRTPLNGILGYAQILQRTEPLSQRGRKGIHIIHQCGTHLLKLIDDLLDSSKIESQNSKFHFSLLDKHWIETAHVVAYEGAKRKILVVDDRWENRSVLVNLLEPLGFEMLEATDGQDGLQQAIATQPDVILTDLNMPGMNGVQLIRQLRSHPQFQETIILSSSTSHPETAIAGSNGFLPKPIQSDQLLDLLRQHLNLIWIYEKLPKKYDAFLAEQDTIKVPSSEIVNRLQQLVKMGDLETAIEEMSHLHQRDPNLAPFAQTVIELAEGCELKALSSFLDQALSR